MSELVSIENLQVVRDGKTICAVPQLSISSGQRLLVQGINGSGKTTLLRTIAGLNRDWQGKVVLGIPQRHCVYVHQNPLLFRGTVMFNAMYGLAAHNSGEHDNTAVVHDWLEKFQIDQLADVAAHKLSGGERRRVSLARALAIRPKLLLLDEPFADLDDAGQKCLTDVIQELLGTAFVIASPTPILQGSNFRTITLE